MLTLAQQLVSASKQVQPITVDLSCVPQSLQEAYHVQGELLQLLNDHSAAWKVGSGNDEHKVFAAPIPSQWLFNNGSHLSLSDYSLIGIELEFAFRLNNIDSINQSFSLEQLEPHITEVAAAIEVVSTRLCHWPDLPAYLKVADLQSNGALIIGDAIAYTSTLNYSLPKISIQNNHTEQSGLIGKNPAGDPRLLLPSLIDQQKQQRRKITHTDWITTGSLSGIYFIDYVSNITGTIEGLPSVNLTIT
ncbi:MAG: hypothetical protein KGQ44_03965 [Betaproteobacteria bacterium]|nr:hypothetical protein [Betaproteobacteria bacterium]